MSVYNKSKTCSALQDRTTRKKRLNYGRHCPLIQSVVVAVMPQSMGASPFLLLKFLVISEKWIYFQTSWSIYSCSLNIIKLVPFLEYFLMRENKTINISTKKQTSNVFLHWILSQKHCSQGKLAYLHSDRKHCFQ